MRRLVLLALPFLLAACGSGGGMKLGTVPKQPGPQAAPTTKPLVVPLHGKASGSAQLRRAASGQKTAITLSVHHAGTSPTAEIAHGSCSKPTALTSDTVLGRLTKGTASWTVPTPYAQLTASKFAVVVRSGDRGIVACGDAPRRAS